MHPSSIQYCLSYYLPELVMVRHSEEYINIINAASPSNSLGLYGRQPGYTQQVRFFSGIECLTSHIFLYI